MSPNRPADTVELAIRNGICLAYFWAPFQAVSRDLETRTPLLEDIACHKTEILSVVEIAVLEERYQALTERTLNTKSKFEADKKRLPVLKQYFMHRDTSKGLVNWLSEIDSMFQESLNVDSLESVEREVEAHCATRAALQDSADAIERTVKNAKTLETAGTLCETDVKGTVV